MNVLHHNPGAYPSHLNQVDYHSWKEKLSNSSRSFRFLNPNQMAYILEYLSVNDILSTRMASRSFYEASMLAISSNYRNFKESLAKEGTIERLKGYGFWQSKPPDVSFYKQYQPLAPEDVAGDEASINDPEFVTAAAVMGLTEVLELFEYPNFDFSRALQTKRLPKHFRRFLKLKLSELEQA